MFEMPEYTVLSHQIKENFIREDRSDGHLGENGTQIRLA